MCADGGDRGSPTRLKKPLWEVWFIEGLDVDGGPADAFALVIKCHHASIDGVAGMEMLTALHDLTAELTPPPVGAAWEPEPAPSTAEVLARAAATNALRPLRLATLERTGNLPAPSLVALVPISLRGRSGDTAVYR